MIHMFKVICVKGFMPMYGINPIEQGQLCLAEMSNNFHLMLLLDTTGAYIGTLTIAEYYKYFERIEKNIKVAE